MTQYSKKFASKIHSKYYNFYLVNNNRSLKQSGKWLLGSAEIDDENSNDEDSRDEKADESET